MRVLCPRRCHFFPAFTPHPLNMMNLCIVPRLLQQHTATQPLSYQYTRRLYQSSHKQTAGRWIDEKDSREIFGHDVIILQKMAFGVFFFFFNHTCISRHSPLFHTASEFPYLLLDPSLPCFSFRGRIVFGAHCYIYICKHLVGGLF